MWKVFHAQRAIQKENAWRHHLHRLWEVAIERSLLGVKSFFLSMLKPINDFSEKANGGLIKWQKQKT
jgi:hypothetical protein